MNRYAISMCLLAWGVCTAGLPCVAAASAPFRLPVGAVVTEVAADGRGWRQNGQLPVTFQAARQQLAAAVRSWGWRCEHSIPLGPHAERMLTSWRRGGERLTLMVWRIDVDRAGFSWGVTKEKVDGKAAVRK